MQQVPQSILSILETYYHGKINITGLRNNGACTAFNLSGMDVTVVMWTDPKCFHNCTIMQGDYYGTGVGCTLEEAVQHAIDNLKANINGGYENWTR